MGVVFNSVKILAPGNNAKRPCGGGVFNVDVEVKGRTDGAGARYVVELWDDDLAIDDLLERVAVPPVAPNKNFTIVTNLALQCDANCKVFGALGNSGESTAEVYAWASEQVPIGGARKGSAAINLICDPDCKGGREEEEERYDPKAQVQG